MEKIVEIENLRKVYYSPKKRFFSIGKNRIKVFEKLNLSFKKGEIVALLGPNGCGKTTLFKLLTTLILPNGGRINVEGFDPGHDPIPVRSKVSFVASQGYFYPRLTGYQNLRFFATLCNLPRSEMYRKLQQIEHIFGLKDVMKKYYQEFSTGFQQKLNIARGILRDYSILLLDEPVKSVDAKSAQSILDYIKDHEVRIEGKTVVMTTHNMSEVENYADRFVIIDRGIVVADFDKTKLKQASLVELYKTYVR